MTNKPSGEAWNSSLCCEGLCETSKKDEKEIKGPLATHNKGNTNTVSQHTNNKLISHLETYST